MKKVKIFLVFLFLTIGNLTYSQNYVELPEVVINGTKPYTEEMRAKIRMAVYLTYPYARYSAKVLKEVHEGSESFTSKREKKKYLKRREDDLRDAFEDKIARMNSFEGKVFMKLVHRFNGQNCYSIIKELKSGFNARIYQTVLFFYKGNLKQNYDPEIEQFDRYVEKYVNEIETNISKNHK
jgi:hypothetical protein